MRSVRSTTSDGAAIDTCFACVTSQRARTQGAKVISMAYNATEGALSAPPCVRPEPLRAWAWPTCGGRRAVRWVGARTACYRRVGSARAKNNETRGYCTLSVDFYSSIYFIEKRYYILGTHTVPPESQIQVQYHLQEKNMNE